MMRTAKLLKSIGSIFLRAWGRGKATNLVTVVAALTLASFTPALAANGQSLIMGVLTNQATAVTRLTANIANPALQIVNTSTSGTALQLVTNTNRPPMTVNSATKVANLNSDKLDGKDSSELARTDLGTDDGAATSAASFTTQTSTTVRAPAKGFLIVNGTVNAWEMSASCNPCYAHSLLFNSTTQEKSDVQVGSIGNGTAAVQDEVVPTTWVFPVDAGDNTIELQTGVWPSGSPLMFRNATLSALYVPYGSTGTSTLGSSSQPASLKSQDEKVSPDGTVK